jgi:GTPase
LEAVIPRSQIETRQKPERAILVAVDTRESRQGWSADTSIAELAALAYSAGANVVGKLVQKMKAPSKTCYLGTGKLEELLKLKESLKFEAVVVDDELTPEQQSNLEETLESKVIDRVALILDIFARRARTHEGKLQVELAQYEYNLPRLAGKWRHLERLGAGIGTRGPGESQLETDKRLMRQRINRLKKQLEVVRRQRDLYRHRRQRSGLPVVSLVGYTNSGKSSLMNALSRSDVLAKDELFSTLDPTTRRMALPDGTIILLTDTVGFIRKLPPALVAAFRATLEELEEANLLIHVVDMTSPYAAQQCDTVEDILADLKLTDKLRITAVNKIDLVVDSRVEWTEERALSYLSNLSINSSPNTVMISAVKRWGLANLKVLIAQMLAASIVK